MLLGGLFLALTSVPVDKAAHFGVSYALTHSCYSFTRNVLKASKNTSLLACTFTTTAVGVAREMHGNKDKNDMYANVYGMGAAIGFITLDW